MAILLNPLNGNISGSAGDLVFRTRNKKTYIASKPGSYKTPTDKKSIMRREKFAFSNKLFGTIGKIMWFKRIWQQSNIYGSNYINKMFTFSYDKFNGPTDFDNVPLLPIDVGFDIKEYSISLVENRIILTTEISSSDTKIKNETTPEVSAQGIAYFNNPKDETNSKEEFFSMVSGNIKLETDKIISFELKLHPLEAKCFELYNYNRIILNLMIKNIEGEPKNASVNLCTSL